MTRELLSRYPDWIWATEPSTDETLLHVAIATRHLDLVELLVAQGVVLQQQHTSQNGRQRKPDSENIMITAWHAVLASSWLDGAKALWRYDSATPQDMREPIKINQNETGFHHRSDCIGLTHHVSSWLAVAMTHASVPLLVWIYQHVLKRPQDQHAFFCAAQAAPRQDVVAAIERLHDKHAREISLMMPLPSTRQQLQHTKAKHQLQPTKNVHPLNPGTMPEPTASTSIAATLPPATPSPVSTSVCTVAAISHDSVRSGGPEVLNYREVVPGILYVDTDAVSSSSASWPILLPGHHEEWGPVLCQKVVMSKHHYHQPHQDAMLARRFQQQLLRLDQQQEFFLRYLTSEMQVAEKHSFDHHHHNCLPLSTSMMTHTNVTTTSSTSAIVWLVFEHGNAVNVLDALRLWQDVFHAVACLHRHDQVHGALTPEYVWRTKNGRAKLFVPSHVERSRNVISEEASKQDDVAALAQCVHQLLCRMKNDNDKACETKTMLASDLENKCNDPETFDLLTNMTTLDPAARLTMSEALLHPRLWPWHQKWHFVETIANHLNHPYPHEPPHDLNRPPRTLRAALQLYIPRYEWVRYLPHRIFAYTCEFRYYAEGNVSDLVRWLRNIKQHGGEVPIDMWLELTTALRFDIGDDDDDSGMDNDIDDTSTRQFLMLAAMDRVLYALMNLRFPDLVLRLWQAVGHVPLFNLASLPNHYREAR